MFLLFFYFFSYLLLYQWDTLPANPYWARTLFSSYKSFSEINSIAKNSLFVGRSIGKLSLCVKYTIPACRLRIKSEHLEMGHLDPQGNLESGIAKFC